MPVYGRVVCGGLVLAGAMVVACGAAPSANEGRDEATGTEGSALAVRPGLSDTATTAAASNAALTSTTPTKATTPSTAPTSATVGSPAYGTLTATGSIPKITLQLCDRFSSWLVQVPQGTACTNVSTGADGSFIGQSGTAWIADLAEYWAHMVAPAGTQPDVSNSAFLAWAESTVVQRLAPFDPLLPGASFCEYWWRSATDQNDGAYQSGYGSTPSEHTAAEAHESILIAQVGSHIEEACMPKEVEQVMDNGCVTHGNHPSCMGCAMVW